MQDQLYTDSQLCESSNLYVNMNTEDFQKPQKINKKCKKNTKNMSQKKGKTIMSNKKCKLKYIAKSPKNLLEKANLYQFFGDLYLSSEEIYENLNRYSMSWFNVVKDVLKIYYEYFETVDQYDILTVELTDKPISQLPIHHLTDRLNSQGDELSKELASQLSQVYIVSASILGTGTQLLKNLEIKFPLKLEDEEMMYQDYIKSYNQFLQEIIKIYPTFILNFTKNEKTSALELSKIQYSQQLLNIISYGNQEFIVDTLSRGGKAFLGTDKYFEQWTQFFKNFLNREQQFGYFINKVQETDYYLFKYDDTVLKSNLTYNYEVQFFTKNRYEYQYIYCFDKIEKIQFDLHKSEEYNFENEFIDTQLSSHKLNQKIEFFDEYYKDKQKSLRFSKDINKSFYSKFAGFKVI